MAVPTVPAATWPCPPDAVVVVVTMVMCVYGRGRGMDGAGVFSPLWLCLQYRPLHGRILPVVVADVVVVVVLTMVMCVWQRTGYGRSGSVQPTMAVPTVPAAAWPYPACCC